MKGLRASAGEHSSLGAPTRPVATPTDVGDPSARLRSATGGGSVLGIRYWRCSSIEPCVLPTDGVGQPAPPWNVPTRVFPPASVTSPV